MLYPENLIYVLLSSFVYSLIEIELEGKDGWMTKIPTANIVYFGGKYLTLYHVYMIFMIIIGVCFQNRMEFTINSFLHSASYVFLFLLLEDILWFVFNPYFTIKRYRKGIVWWHSSQPWIFGMPLHNYTISGLNIVLAYITGMTDILYSLLYSCVFVGVCIFVSPLYHYFYTYIHKKKGEAETMGPSL